MGQEGLGPVRAPKALPPVHAVPAESSRGSAHGHDGQQASETRVKQAEAQTCLPGVLGGNAGNSLRRPPPNQTAGAQCGGAVCIVRGRGAPAALFPGEGTGGRSLLLRRPFLALIFRPGVALSPRPEGRPLPGRNSHLAAGPRGEQAAQGAYGEIV